MELERRDAGERHFPLQPLELDDAALLLPGAIERDRQLRAPALRDRVARPRHERQHREGADDENVDARGDVAPRRLDHERRARDDGREEDPDREIDRVVPHVRIPERMSVSAAIASPFIAVLTSWLLNLAISNSDVRRSTAERFDVRRFSTRRRYSSAVSLSRRCIP